MQERREPDGRGQGEHTITLERRGHMTLTGVTDVPSFCEQTIVAETAEGALTVIGDGLQISRLNLQDGIVQIDGRVTAMEYGDAPVRKGKGVWSRLLQ